MKTRLSDVQAFLLKLAREKHEANLEHSLELRSKAEEIDRIAHKMLENAIFVVLKDAGLEHDSQIKIDDLGFYYDAETDSEQAP